MSIRYSDASFRNEVYNKFEGLGLPIEKWDFKAQEDYPNFYSNNAEVDDPRYPPMPELDGYIIEPIYFKDSLTNDRYELRFKAGLSTYDFKNITYNKKENGIWEISGGSYSDDFDLKFIRKGVSFLRGEVVQRGQQIVSELETLESFDDGRDKNYAEVFADDPLISVAKVEFDITKLVASQIKNGEKLLKKSQDILFDLKKAEEEGTLKNAMFSVEEVDKLYNTKISNDDKRAFLIWLQNRNGKKLIGDFANKYGSEYPTPPNVIIELMTKGKLFFVKNAPIGERLQPKVIFQSGNIWTKWSDLINETNSEDFKKDFGEEIYKTHLEVLKPTWLNTWENRLRVAPEDKVMRLVMLPTSSMAKEVKVDKFISVRDRDQIKNNFEIYTNFKKGEAEQDVLRGKGSRASNNFITKKSITLQTAFLLWCKDAGSGEVSAEFGVQWSNKTKNVQDLVDRYISPSKNPYKKDKKKGEEKWAREKDDARKVGQRLFALFLEEGLEANDQNRIEILWNSTFNFYVDPILEQIPIGFTYKKYLDNQHLFILREANLKALRYYLSQGSVGLAYGVGIGKTFCSIFVMKQALDLGLCTRPLVIVPNQVYFQFSQEIRRGLGADFDPTDENTRLNMFYNGSGQYNVLANNAVDGINLCTYEASLNFEFEKEKIFDEESGTITADWLERGARIYLQGNESTATPKLLTNHILKSKKSLFNEFEVDTDDSQEDEKNTTEEANTNQFEEDFAKGGKTKVVEPIFVNSDTTGYDFVCVDEAHNFNTLFGKVFSAVSENQTDSDNVTREKNPYSAIRETSGGKEASARAEKLFWLTRYIQSKSQIKNTLLLSATPFTNSPTQVFSLLTILNYEMLEEASVGIMKDFYDLFAKVEYAEDFTTDLRIVKREKLTGWVNIIAMQKLVYRAFDKSSREDEDKAVIRPQKIVLPLKRIEVDGKVVEMAKSNHISTTIKLSQKQIMLWNDVRAYAQGGENAPTYDELCSPENQNTTSLGKYKPPKSAKNSETDEGTEIDIENPDDLADGSVDGEKAKNGAKALQCLMWGRQLCLNPYLFKCSGYKTEPTAQEYVEASPKMLYTMECIRSVKDYHEKEGSVVSGQVIYMNFGVSAFPLLRDYLVEELGYDINEIGIISGKGNYVGKKRYKNKSSVQDYFLGRILDSESGEYKQLDDGKRVKVLLGSEAIKEGINLQDYATVLYNIFLDFNPTDQVQVEGRIWRQDNAFANVRIVLPLMADCIDVFMFQKLQDKTERINQFWTRSGNKNELDTTAFDPAELKFELMSDPVAIATLERENKSEKLDDEIVDETEIYSGFKSLENIFNKHQKVTFKNLSRDARENFIINGYYFLSVMRPDLILKPLLNQEGYLVYLKKLALITSSEFDYLKQEYPTFWDLMQYYNFNNFNFSDALNIGSYNQLQNNAQFDNFKSVVNYTAKDIIDLMVLFNKEQKIAFPRGYSKNWRETKLQPTLPLMFGEKVSYDGRKGKKKGVITMVLNKFYSNVYEDFILNLNDSRYYSLDGGRNVPKEEIVKEFVDSKFNRSKATEEEVAKAFSVTDIKSFLEFNDDDETDDSKNNLEKNINLSLDLYSFYVGNNSSLWAYSNQVGDSFIRDNLTPYIVDVDEVEDIKITDKNVTLITPRKSTSVKPTKYPDAYTWSNKDAVKNLYDSNEYLKAISKDLQDAEISTDFQFPQTINARNVSMGNDLKAWIIQESISQEPLLGIGTDYYWKSPLSYLFSDDSQKGFIGMYFTFDEKVLESLYSKQKTWIECQEKFDRQFGAFYNEGKQWYFNKFPRDLAEFNVAYKDKLQPNNLNTISDIQIKLNESLEKVNSLKLEQTQLFTEEVFKELVEEVERKQQELSEEEIREGNSFRARAESFATPNSEYLGNDYLSIFSTKWKQELERLEELKEVKEVDEAVEINEEKQTAQSLIDKYNNLLNYIEEDKAELTKSYIAKLQMAMKFM